MMRLRQQNPGSFHVKQSGKQKQNRAQKAVAILLARCARVPRATVRLSALSSWQGALRPPYIPPVERAERAKERPWPGSIGARSSRWRAGARGAASALLSAVGGLRRIAGPQSFRAGRPQSAPALWRAWLTPGASLHTWSTWPGWTLAPTRPLTSPARSGCAPRRRLARARRNKT